MCESRGLRLSIKEKVFSVSRIHGIGSGPISDLSVQSNLNLTEEHITSEVARL
jgi:hypothetical protein